MQRFAEGWLIVPGVVAGGYLWLQIVNLIWSAVEWLR